MYMCSESVIKEHRLNWRRTVWFIIQIFMICKVLCGYTTYRSEFVDDEVFFYVVASEHDMLNFIYIEMCFVYIIELPCHAYRHSGMWTTLDKSMNTFGSIKSKELQRISTLGANLYSFLWLVEPATHLHIYIFLSYTWDLKMY